MIRSRGDMTSPTCLLVMATFCLVAYVSAGPLPNMTALDMGLKEGSCALGDVVYLPGDEFPGSSPCEKCSCANGGVQCTKQQCEPRPGCKALHRPDHCCPTYQCECEQEGRVYGNGEKLVDPADPCRVCYCQGGEVVCRRIACFVRNDCTPRLVSGRCCPEYDNCPLRGVTALPGMTSQPAFTLTQDQDSNPLSTPKEKIKQEFTIKEITPVSEIPVITEVKIKEILPSPSMEVSEYSSSKSPLIPREATSEKSIKFEEPKTESPTVIEVHPASSEIKDVIDKGDSTPSKISFSTQDSINSDIYPSLVPVIANHPSSEAPATTTKSPIIEEEEDHNPAFPPLPEDLSVFSTHEEEIAQEPSMDSEHGSPDVSSISSEAKEESLPTTPAGIVTKEKALDIFSQSTTVKDEGSTTESSVSKGSPMLNLRSVIPTEILSAPAYVPDEFSGTTDIENTLIITSTTEEPKNLGTSTEETPFSTDVFIEYSSSISPVFVEISTEPSTDLKLETSSPEVKFEPHEEQMVSSTTVLPEIVITTQAPKVSETETTTKTSEEQTTISISKSNIATEVTSQTELSSLPIETSDQKPQQSESVSRDKPIISTSDPFPKTSNIPTSSSEVITVSKILPNDNSGFENIETTEFILTSFGSSETSTDTVELIKISGDFEKSSSIIEAPESKKNNVLTDLINLVSDVASISDHTDQPSTMSSAKSTNISDSEELIPVNAVYKSKSNYNQNSITEVPLKNKNTPLNKQKIVEIEDDDAGITDSPPPNDKKEPTTRRPIIDKVSENTMPGNKTEKKDIEIITQSYVPTINRRPTKVVMKEEAGQVTTESPLVTESNESSDVTVATENNVSSKTTPTPVVVVTPEIVEDTTISVQ
ncbi:hypothetical protein K1T71_003616 [Dendrolimus kikuchii]|uniref:Uncharacterized protein n=1 Tax=Dendrolimus kikuchii TaxID=765133 RepID=A0ACC1D8L5_9NEOP|nr:hypothetical protein K1T71_003616 [Dendrolimus kikuchii]